MNLFDGKRNNEKFAGLYILQFFICFFFRPLRAGCFRLPTLTSLVITKKSRLWPN